MPRTKADRRRAELIREWTRSAEKDERMALDYRNAATILQNQGRDLDALLLEDIANDCARGASAARETIARLHAEA